MTLLVEPNGLFHKTADQLGFERTAMSKVYLFTSIYINKADSEHINRDEVNTFHLVFSH